MSSPIRRKEKKKAKTHEFLKSPFVPDYLFSGWYPWWITLCSHITDTLLLLYGEGRHMQPHRLMWPSPRPSGMMLLDRLTTDPPFSVLLISVPLYPPIFYFIDTPFISVVSSTLTLLDRLSPSNRGNKRRLCCMGAVKWKMLNNLCQWTQWSEENPSVDPQHIYGLLNDQIIGCDLFT